MLFTLVAIGLAGCSEDNADNGCVPTSKALEEVSSLANIVNTGKVAGRPSCTVYTGARIFACKYKGETTYYFTNPASSLGVCVSIAYDCHGDEILNWADDNAAWTAFEAETSEGEELWKKP